MNELENKNKLLEELLELVLLKYRIFNLESVWKEIVNDINAFLELFKKYGFIEDYLAIMDKNNNNVQELFFDNLGIIDVSITIDQKHYLNRITCFGLDNKISQGGFTYAGGN